VVPAAVAVELTVELELLDRVTAVETKQAQAEVTTHILGELQVAVALLVKVLTEEMTLADVLEVAV
jgi:hypothetical protein